MELPKNLSKAIINQFIQAALDKLDVVPREEFEVQSQVLLKTREKLEKLEEKVKQLESR